MIDIELPEWSFVDASVDKRLASRGLLDARSREIAARLAQRRELEITTREDGLAIRSLAHVGRIELNDVRITIRPKISPQMLLELLRYAYSLRNLHLIDSATFDSGDRGLQDLLIAQLHAEARELLARGLGRRYVRCAEELGSPRGRIMVDRLARARSPLVATLPCTHHPRSSDFLLNRVLRSGLELARQLAQSRHLKQMIARTAQIYADLAQLVPLHRETIRAAESAVDRLSVAYAPALRLIRLIHEGSHLDLEGGASLKLQGFLFDMNRFFQALLSRFLRENLPDCEVVDELPLRELMAYSPGFNPRNRRAPLPRPDFVVRRRRAAPQLLDAKYRDIWETDLPREMLYQLAVYAMSQPPGATAAILYPTGAAAARESIIEIREPATTSIRAFVALRPVIVPQVLELLRANGDRQRDREILARKLVFGAADVG